MEVTLRAGDATFPAAFVLTALDTVEDGRQGYDTLIADQDTDTGNGTLGRARAGGWFPLQMRAPHPDGGTRTIGAWCMVQTMAPDLAEVRIYRGAFHAVEGYPRAFRERIEDEASFWPGAPDEFHLERGIRGDAGIEVRDYLAQAARFSAFFTAATVAAVRGERFDLLLSYQPVVDEVGHAFTLRDARQAAWSRARLARATPVSLSSVFFDVADATLPSEMVCTPLRAAWTIWSCVRERFSTKRSQKMAVASYTNCAH